MKKAFVYILKCFDDSYYVGYTTNLERRLNQHNSAHNLGSYTSTRRPVTLFYQHEFETIKEAKDAERQLKNWSRAKKEALAKGDFNLLHKLAECRNESHYKYHKGL